MKLRKCFIILITLCIIVFSCKKDEPCRPYDFTIFVSESLYPLLFDKGSSWQYLKKDDDKLEIVEIIHFEYFSHIEYAYGHGGNCPAGTLIYFYRMVHNSSIYGEYILNAGYGNISACFNCGGVRHFPDQPIGYHKLNATVSEKFDTLHILGSVYHNVVKIEITEDWLTSSDINLFWADSIGIIRKEIKENNNIIATWDLQSYDVNLFIPPQ